MTSFSWGVTASLTALALIKPAKKSGILWPPLLLQPTQKIVLPNPVVKIQNLTIIALNQVRITAETERAARAPTSPRT